MKPFASCYCIHIFLTNHCYSSPFGATSTTMKKPDETSEAAGLLTIPREIRDTIYEGIFHLEDFHLQQAKTRSKLDTSILRVSRQLSHEAFETLYEKHSWITGTATDQIMSTMAWAGLNSIFGVPRHQGHKQPIARYDNDALSNSAILHMDLRQDSDMPQKKTNFVVPLALMPQFCRFITHSRWVHYTDLVLRFNCNARASHQARLLGYLGQARGLRKVDNAGPDLHWASLSTILLMTHPYKGIAEILNTMSYYQERSENELKHGRTLLAGSIIQDGVDFVDWWSDRMRGQMARLHTIEDTDLDMLFEARADMGFSSASLSLRVDDIESAQLAVKNVLQRLYQDDRLSIIHKTRAHYHMAQTFEALEWRNAALHSYLQALRFRPGYSEADAAVDKMERNLGSGTALEDARVKHNIDHVLSRFRSRPAHSTTIPDRDYNVIFRKFEGTAAEIRSVDRASTEEVSRPYRKTPGVLLTTHRRTWCT